VLARGGDKKMAKSHDITARRIAKQVKGRYTLSKSPDIKGKLGRVDVKSIVNEIPKALRQLEEVLEMPILYYRSQSIQRH